MVKVQKLNASTARARHGKQFGEKQKKKKKDKEEKKHSST